MKQGQASRPALISCYSALALGNIWKLLTITSLSATEVLMLTATLLVLVFAALAALVLLFQRLRKLKAEHTLLSQQHDSLKDRFRPVIDAEAEKQRVLGELEQERARLQEVIGHIRVNQQEALQELHAQRQRGEADMAAFQSSIDRLRAEFNALDEEANLQSFGFYKPRYAFADSARYQRKLDDIREHQKQMIKNKSAATCRVEWTVNGSKIEGRKQINQTLKLMLRAFNGECDASVAKVRYNNINVMETRIRKAYETINGMAEIQTCHITPGYLNLKLEELYLAYEYQDKVQQEKEEQRRIREQMREEEIAQRELEKAKFDAEKEERRYAEALRKATEEAERAVGEKQQKLLWQGWGMERPAEHGQTKQDR